MPTPFLHSCAYCRLPFEAVRSDAVTCGPTCRRALFRARRRAARLAAAATFFGAFTRPLASAPS